MISSSGDVHGAWLRVVDSMADRGHIVIHVVNCFDILYYSGPMIIL